jgi:hypothetical protein
LENSLNLPRKIQEMKKMNKIYEKCDLNFLIYWGNKFKFYGENELLPYGAVSTKMCKIDQSLIYLVSYISPKSLAKPSQEDHRQSPKPVK